MSSLRWALVEMFRGLFRHAGRMFIAMLITALALIVPVVTASVATSLYAPLKSVSVAQEMTVFADKGIGAERASALKTRIEDIPGILSVKVVSPEDAMKQIAGKTNQKFEQSSNPLPYVLVATVSTAANAESVKAAAGTIEKLQGIDSVAYDSSWNNNLHTIRTALTKFSFFSFSLLGALILMVLVGTAHLVVTTTVKTAERLKVFGASPGFIARPDAWRGGFVFLLSSLAALIVSDLALSEVAPALTMALGLYHLPVTFAALPGTWQLGFIAASAAAGTLFSGIASRLLIRKAR